MQRVSARVPESSPHSEGQQPDRKEPRAELEVHRAARLACLRSASSVTGAIIVMVAPVRTRYRNDAVYGDSPALGRLF